MPFCGMVPYSGCDHKTPLTRWREFPIPAKHEKTHCVQTRVDRGTAALGIVVESPQRGTSEDLERIARRRLFSEQ